MSHTIQYQKSGEHDDPPPKRGGGDVVHYPEIYFVCLKKVYYISILLKICIFLPLSWLYIDSLQHPVDYIDSLQHPVDYIDSLQHRVGYIDSLQHPVGYIDSLQHRVGYIDSLQHRVGGDILVLLFILM